jgi:iron complex transport system substrate-binding protein
LENLGKYHADVLLVDARDSGAVKELKKTDIYKRLPAVAGGQQFLWYPTAPYSYDAYAEVFGTYADHLEAARVLKQE